MSDEWAKATQEVAKTAREGIAAGRGVGSFVAEFVREPLVQQFGIWTDNLRYRRWENQLALQRKVRAKLAENGLDHTKTLREPPMSVLVPLLEAAALAEEDELQERWANLLLNFSNAESGIAIQKVFVAILRDLSPLEARCLDLIYGIETKKGLPVVTGKLPDLAYLLSDPDEVVSRERQELTMPTNEILVALGNLARLGLVESAMAFGGPMTAVNQTEFGREFLRACTLQKPATF